jgi:hypothetical protein
MSEQMALHANRLVFKHPVTQVDLDFYVSNPLFFSDLLE